MTERVESLAKVTSKSEAVARELSPPAIWGPVNENESAVVRTRRKLAEANAKFYGYLLDCHLNIGSLNWNEVALEDLLKIIPPSAISLYSQGLAQLSERRTRNAQLLEQMRGQEVTVLLGEGMLREGISQEKIVEVLNKAQNVHFREPTEGVAMLVVSQNFFGLLKKVGLVLRKASAIYFRQEEQMPGFMIVPTLGSFFVPEDQRRHEMSHMIWDFVGNFRRQSDEQTAQRREAFDHFRDELIAYIATYSDFDQVSPAYLVYTKNWRIRNLAKDSRDFAALCMSYHGDNGRLSFAWAAATSRNFADLAQRFSDFTVKEKPLEWTFFNDMLYMYQRRNASSGVIADFLRRQQVPLSTDYLVDVIAIYLMGYKDLRTKLAAIDDFAQAVGIELPDKKEILKEVGNRRKKLVRLLEKPPEELKVEFSLRYQK